VAAALLLLAGIAAAFLLVSKKSATSTSIVPEKSIAVLPFQNLSRDPDNAYFADGIQEEILTRLAGIADLKVISRSSTQQYQSKPRNLREIAKQLGVASILEGSVQRTTKLKFRIPLRDARIVSTGINNLASAKLCKATQNVCDRNAWRPHVITMYATTPSSI
jgi:TolB-like protein